MLKYLNKKSFISSRDIEQRIFWSSFEICNLLHYNWKLSVIFSFVFYRQVLVSFLGYSIDRNTRFLLGPYMQKLELIVRFGVKLAGNRI
jgi:hypothetical protein